MPCRPRPADFVPDSPAATHADLGGHRSLDHGLQQGPEEIRLAFSTDICGSDVYAYSEGMAFRRILSCGGLCKRFRASIRSGVVNPSVNVA
jgi:hypothetical protein